ncbi:hypothetical protein ElyMa_000668000 [Elysia marginata]|uniref:Uncharacterized protein n=1 Tax=Elysia marginata TaxID=1093978 RepID=A0AAV4GG61_9GAST|nr:hypothetical protein ElyMa_000668000 [Elysia marginata]
MQSAAAFKIPSVICEQRRLGSSRVPPAVTTALVDQQERTIARIQDMRSDQSRMRKRLDKIMPSVLAFRANMKQALLHEKADRAVIDSLSVRVARLNNRFNKLVSSRFI